MKKLLAALRQTTQREIRMYSRLVTSSHETGYWKGRCQSYEVQLSEALYKNEQVRINCTLESWYNTQQEMKRLNKELRLKDQANVKLAEELEHFRNVDLGLTQLKEQELKDNTQRHEEEIEALKAELQDKINEVSYVEEQHQLDINDLRTVRAEVDHVDI